MKWQPIKTAPKDGTWILAWSDGDYDVVQWIDDSFAVDGYFSPAAGGSIDPEYWMPLPNPPKTKAS